MRLPKAKHDGVLMREIGDEAVAYLGSSHRFHRLSPSALAVWRRCDGTTTVREMADELAARVGRPVPDEVVEFAVEGLLSAGLVEAPAEPMTSRRSVLRKLGWTGATAALLPLVTAMLAPQPAAAASTTTVVTPDPCQSANNRTLGCPCSEQGQAECGPNLFCVNGRCTDEF